MKKHLYPALILSLSLGLLACETPDPTTPSSPEPEVSAPAEEPTEEPSEEPAETPAEEPTEEPSEEPAETPAEEPTEEPSEEPSEEPTAPEVDNSPPKIESISATEGPVGQALTVIGSHLQNVSGVKFNDVNAQFKLVNNQEMTLYVPGGLVDGLIVFETNEDPVTYPERFTVTNTVWFVNAEAEGNANGTNWSDAFTDLQDALAIAQEDDQIWVAEGSYTPSSTGDRNASFVLPNDVAIYGGFSGNESNRDQRNWDDHPTYLSGDLGGNDDYSDNSTTDMIENSYHIVEGGIRTTLDGFTIRGGQAGGDNENAHGGGMYTNQNIIFLKHIVFSHNRSTEDGGALSLNATTATLDDVTFEDNFSSEKGGAIANRDNSVTEISDGQFIGNHATVQGGAINNISAALTLEVSVLDNNRTSDSGDGGAIYNGAGGDLTLMDVTLSNNFSQDGGALYNAPDSRVEISDSAFNDNEAENNGGALINNDADQVQLNHVTFVANHVSGFGGGGAIYNQGVKPTFNQVVFRNNSAANSHGGAIWNLNSTGFYRNLLFSNNSARNGRGGGIYNDNSSPQIYHASFSRNNAKTGGGVFNISDSAPQFFNSILWAPPETNAVVLHESSGILTLNNCLVQGLGGLNHRGTNNQESNPGFVDESNPRGADDEYFTADDGLQLKAGSPAINLGQPGPEHPVLDILGQGRSGAPDAGAYEFKP